MNEAMHILFSIYGNYDGSWITAAAAEYVWENTRPESQLRKFIKALIIHYGPLCPRALSREKDVQDQEKDWHKLIKGGGELVLDIALTGTSFMNDGDDKIAPHTEGIRFGYIIKEPVRLLDDL